MIILNPSRLKSDNGDDGEEITNLLGYVYIFYITKKLYYLSWKLGAEKLAFQFGVFSRGLFELQQFIGVAD